MNTNWGMSAQKRFLTWFIQSNSLKMCFCLLIWSSQSQIQHCYPPGAPSIEALISRQMYIRQGKILILLSECLIAKFRCWTSHGVRPINRSTAPSIDNLRMMTLVWLIKYHPKIAIRSVVGRVQQFSQSTEHRIHAHNLCRLAMPVNLILQRLIWESTRISKKKQKFD